MRYRKKPVTVEAMQWDGDNATGIVRWAQGDWKAGGIWLRQKSDDPDALPGSPFVGSYFLVIPTLEGEMDAAVGDWIVCDGGDLYPCKPYIFNRTYEVAA